MNYNETLEYIHNIPKFNRVLGNDLLKKLLDKMGNPHRKLQCIHIGGTNGKGSTCTMVAEVLKQSGCKVGLFTSPYLERFNERIRINGIPISNDDLIETVEYVKSISEKYDAKVSEFAFDTAVAFEYFKKNQCDAAVIEVGLGGKLDATNVIENPLAVGFTAIGLDHCQYLGDNIDKISMEKFGIIKQNSDVVLYPLQDEAVFKNAKLICEKKNSNLIIPCIRDISDINTEKNTFRYKDKKYTLAMSGKFQIYNAVTAIEIINTVKEKGCAVSDLDIENGLKIAKIDGRFDYQNKNLIIDGAHNPQAAAALLTELGQVKRTIHFLTAVMQDKDYPAIVRMIAAFAKQNDSKVTVTEIDMPRCLSCGELSREFAKHGITALAVKNPKEALANIENTNIENDLICVCGSLYLAGEIKRSE